MKTLITRIKRLALALCFVTPLVSWAVEMTNPVTGEPETYENKYTGTNGSWNEAGNWDTGSIPYVSGGVYTSALVDGGGTETVVTGTSIDGWAMKLGVYGGAKVTISDLAKWTGGNGTDYATVDSTSKLTITSMSANNWNHVVNYYVASPGGITYKCAFAPANDAATIQYNLAGNGSVVYESTVNKAGHLIKAADVTLSGSATPSVESKTLVSFTSTTKTFTADAAIKVYGIDGETEVETVNLATINTTGTTTLTEDSAVGTCELVQTTTGIVLYYVDGDPDAIVAKTYQPSISVNLCDGSNPLTTAADVGFGDFAVPGTSWNNILSSGGNNSVFTTPLSTIYGTDSTGAQTLIPNASAAVSGTRGSWSCSSLASASDVRNGYADENGTYTTPTVTISGIPYYQYKVVVYTATDAASKTFGYVTVNGTDYTYVEGSLSEGTAAWGASGAANTAETLAEGVNVLVSPVTSGSTATVVGHRGGNDVRGCIAAVQIVEVPKTAEEGELVINVSGDTTYPVNENATYTTVYVIGVGTLSFSGEGAITTTTLNVGNGATVPMGSSITPTTVTGAGTVVYDGAQPSTTVGFNNSASWFGTVWVKNVGSNGESSKVSTVLGTDTATATGNVLKDWGNENSSVKFTNVRGWTGTAVCPWTLILEDDGTNYAWYNNNGYAARSTTFAALKGSGTFYDKSVDNKPCRQKITFTDGSQFTGALYAEGKRVGLGGENTRGDAEDNNGTIEVVSGATATVASGKTWTAGTGSILVAGTLYANGTLAGTSTTRAVRGSGTVVFTGAAPSPTGDAWWKNSDWTGTVQMKSVTLVGTDLAFNDYGNTGSVLELNGCSGWLTPAYTCTVPLKITGTLTLNDGYSGKDNAFKVGTLLGDGTISGSSNAPTMVFNVTDDCSNFTGKVQLNNKCVVFGSTIPDSLTEGRIYIAEGAQVTVQNTAEAGWWAVGGIQVDGELRANSLARFGGGTNITTSDNGVFTLVSDSNTDDTTVDYARLQGTGTLKFEGSAYRCISTNNFPTTMTVENNLTAGFLHKLNGVTATIGSLSGSGYLRSDWNNGARTIKVLQAKDTTWSGLLWNSNPQRIGTLIVAPGASTAGTLTLSGTQVDKSSSDMNAALQVESGASVNLTGTWVGATTVAGTIGGTGTLTGDLTFSDGATFKAFASDDEDGLVVSGTVGYPAEGKVTVDVSAIEPEADVALIKAADLDASKFALAEGTPEGYSLEVVEGVLTLKVPVTKVTIMVPEVPNTTVTVAISGETIGTAAGNYEVAPGSVVTVTYAAASGYAISGTTQYTIDTTTETTFEITDTATAQYVARVRNYGTSQNEDFTSLNEAIAVAGGTAYANNITLLADITDAVTIDKAISLAGQGRTISAAVTISSDGYLSLMGPTLTGKLTIGANGAFAVTGTGSVLPEVETQDGASIALRTLSADTVALTVTTLTVNGTLTLSSTAQGTVRGTPYKAFSYVTDNATFGEGAEIVGDGEYSASTEVEGDNTVVSMTITAVAKIGDEYYDDLDEAVADAIANDTVVELLIQPEAAVTLGVGQTLKVKAYSYTLEVNLASGLTNPPYSISSALDTGTTITTYTVNAAFAKIGNTTYPTLAAAIEAATSGDTVTLLADVDVSDEGVTFPADTTLTLDLNNCTITAANTETGHVQVNGALTITDSSEEAGGKIVSGTSGTYGVVQVAEKDVTGASLTIAGGAIEAYFEDETDSEGQHPAYGVAVKGTGTTFTMTGGSIKAGYMALMGHGKKASGGTYTISGGTLTSMSDFVAYFPTKGDCAVTISGGTFSGLGGVSARAGTVTITGGTFTATGNGAAPGSAPGTTGLGFMALAVTPNYGNVTVSVSGGTFTSATDVAAVMATTSTYTGTISLTGGTYSTDPSDYVADGYIATESAGVYTVKQGTWVAEVGGTKFESLAEAVTAAQSGDTVTLLVDVDVSNEGVTFPASTTLTLDLNNCTLTAANTATGHIQVNGALTITDNSEGAAGKIVSGTSGTYGVVQVAENKTQEGAALTIAGGTIEAYFPDTLNDDNQHPAYGVVVKGKDTVFSMTGGKVKAGLMAVMGHGSKASAGTYTISGGTIESVDDFAMYLPTKNGCSVTISGGTFTGAGAISARAGTLSITGGTFTASGTGIAPGASVGTTGLSFAALATWPNYGDVTVTVSGGSFTSASDVAAVVATTSTYTGTISLTGGTYSTDVSDYCADGYEATETSTGVWTVAVVQEVPVEAGTQTEPVETYAEAEAAAAKVVPSVPAAVAAKLTEEQQTAYKELFEAKVVEVTDGETPKYAVEVALTADAETALQADVDAEAEDLADAAVAAAANATTGGTATVTTKPGLYYVVEAGSDIGSIEPASCTLANSTETELNIPNKGTSGFYKIRVSVTPVTVTTPVEP